jgi:hypothetical protein
MLKGDPRWTHRRRLVYATVALGTLMILFGAIVFRSEIVASELIRNGTILLGAILSGYVFAATWDDKGRDIEPPHFD